VFAGFSALRNKAKSFNIVSLTVIFGYLSLFSLTSLSPFVTIDPRAYSKNVVDSSAPCNAYKLTGSSYGGILIGSSTLWYFAGPIKNFWSFNSFSNESLVSLYYTIRRGSPLTTFPSSINVTGQYPYTDFS
jgi:hypothetical protein